MNIELETLNDGKIYSQWGDMDVHLRLDTIASTFSFTAYMTEENRHLFKPFAYIECRVWKVADDGKRYKLITGFIVNATATTQKVPKMSTISGFSKCGILENVTFPQELYPLQYNGSSLASICKKICDYFGLTLYVHEGAADDAYERYTQNASVVGVGTVLNATNEEVFDKEFKRLQAKPDEEIKKFLSRVAKEKGITVAHNENGDLMLYKILNVIDASSQLTISDQHFEMALTPNMQGVHSECTVISETDTDDDETTEITDNSVTVKSPWFKGVEVVTGKNADGTFKTKTVPLPTTIQAKNIKHEDMQEYAESELAREAKNFPLTMKKYGWMFEDTVNGGLRSVRAGFYLNVDAPSIFIAKQKMVIDSMRFTKEAKKPEMLQLTCVLPCVYTGKLPKESPFTD